MREVDTLLDHQLIAFGQRPDGINVAQDIVEHFGIRTMIRFESQQAAVEQLFGQRMGAGTFLGKG